MCADSRTRYTHTLIWKSRSERNFSFVMFWFVLYSPIRFIVLDGLLLDVLASCNKGPNSTPNTANMISVEQKITADFLKKWHVIAVIISRKRQQ